MAYFPKSKILVKNTPGNKFVYKDTSKEYIGDYLELSNGTYFAGSNTSKLGKELILGSEDGSNKSVILNNNIYNILKESYFKKFQKLKPLLATRPKPTEKDYKNGKYTRYFAIKSNNRDVYFEINKKTYDSLSNKKLEYDVNMFKPGQIKWSLEIDAFSINTRALRVYEQTYPNVSKFFRNPGEFAKRRG